MEPRGPLSCDTVLKIFYQTCRAVQHMHRQKPPIIHRDLKVPPPARPVGCTPPPARVSRWLALKSAMAFPKEGCSCFLTSEQVSGSFSIEAVPSTLSVSFSFAVSWAWGFMPPVCPSPHPPALLLALGCSRLPSLHPLAQEGDCSSSGSSVPSPLNDPSAGRGSAGLLCWPQAAFPQCHGEVPTGRRTWSCPLGEWQPGLDFPFSGLSMKWNGFCCVCSQYLLQYTCFCPFFPVFCPSGCV